MCFRVTKSFCILTASAPIKNIRSRSCASIATAARFSGSRRRGEGTPYDNRHRKSSYAASTPATDGKLVYAFFGTEGLYAYDYNGKLAWKAQLGNLGTVGMGTGTSPILFENLVIVQCDEENGESSFIVALNDDEV